MEDRGEVPVRQLGRCIRVVVDPPPMVVGQAATTRSRPARLARPQRAVRLLDEVGDGLVSMARDGDPDRTLTDGTPGAPV
jgi:transposase